VVAQALPHFGVSVSYQDACILLGIDVPVTEFEWAKRITPKEDGWLTVETMQVLLAHNKAAPVFSGSIHIR